MANDLKNVRTEIQELARQAARASRDDLATFDRLERLTKLETLLSRSQLGATRRLLGFAVVWVLATGIAGFLSCRRVDREDITADVHTSQVRFELPAGQSVLMVSSAPEVEIFAQGIPDGHLRLAKRATNPSLELTVDKTDKPCSIEMTWIEQQSALHIDVSGLPAVVTLSAGGYLANRKQGKTETQEIPPSTLALQGGQMGLEFKNLGHGATFQLRPLRLSSVKIGYTERRQEGSSMVALAWSDLEQATIRFADYPDRLSELHRGTGLVLEGVDLRAHSLRAGEGIDIDLAGRVSDVRTAPKPAGRSLMPTLLDLWREQGHLVAIAVTASSIVAALLGISRAMRGSS